MLSVIKGAERKLLSPLVPAITAILAVVVGILASEFFAEIVSAFPFCCLAQWGAFSWKAFLFWLTLMCLAGLVFARHHIEAQDSRTSPSPDFRGEFARLARSTTFALEANVPRHPTGDKPFEKMQTAIRDLLSAITSLALRHDGTPLVHVCWFSRKWRTAALRKLVVPPCGRGFSQASGSIDPMVSWSDSRACHACFQGKMLVHPLC